MQFFVRIYCGNEATSRNFLFKRKKSYREIGKSIEIDHKSIVKWVRQYNYNGAEALVKRCTSYTQMFKLEVLQYMTENGTSLCESAAIFNIPAHSTLAVWKRKFET